MPGIHISVAGRRRASPEQRPGSGGGFLEALHDPRTHAQPQLSRARQVTADIPSRERRQPRREFEQAERLDQVVVCPASRPRTRSPMSSRAVSISTSAQTPAARSGRHGSKPSKRQHHVKEDRGAGILGRYPQAAGTVSGDIPRVPPRGRA
jgi:hypothetical protein